MGRTGAHTCQRGRHIVPCGAPWRIALAHIARELCDLRIAERITKAGHEAQFARSRLADAVHDDLQQVVWPVAVQVAVERQGHVHAQQARAVAVVVAGRAGAIEQPLCLAGLRGQRGGLSQTD